MCFYYSYFYTMCIENMFRCIPTLIEPNNHRIQKYVFHFANAMQCTNRMLLITFLTHWGFLRNNTAGMPETAFLVDFYLAGNQLYDWHCQGHGWCGGQEEKFQMFLTKAGNQLCLCLLILGTCWTRTFIMECGIRFTLSCDQRDHRAGSQLKTLWLLECSHK